ncbi:unnamed protein product [Strongylus vulgaris]|uniref:Uncharacterized protein n=1 Tax=Strongylus vulgaris TaxID=40348 RepID=A0A3P7IRJ7_STRVU|nr:unnamed protein product [Strongylus vulgaris]
MRKAKLRWKKAESPVKEEVEKEILESPPNVGTSWEELAPTEEHQETSPLDEEKNLSVRIYIKYALLE